MKNVFVKRKARCKECGSMCKRHSIRTNIRAAVEYKRSVHHCLSCGKYFIIGPSLRSRYPEKVRREALRLSRCGKSLPEASLLLYRKFHIFVPVSTLHDWFIVERSDRFGGSE